MVADGVTRAGAQSISQGTSLASMLFAATVVAAFSMSSMLLARLGFAYDTEGGGALQKVHPATFMGLLALLVGVYASGRPLTWLNHTAARFPGVTLFMFMWTLLVAFAVLVQHAPISTLLDNYLIAAITIATIR